MIRIFERPTSTKWKELILIDDENDVIKIYNQDKELGFPFSEHKTSIKEYGYQSADDFYKTVCKREKNNLGHVNIKELDPNEQMESEIIGLRNLEKYRKDNKLQYNDVIEKLKEYGVAEEKTA